MTGTRELILLGGGGHAAVVADAARAAGWSVLGVLDDEPLEKIDAIGLAHLGPIDALGEIAASRPVSFHAAVGDGHLRQAWLEGIEDDRCAIVVHPSAVVSPSAVLEPAAFVGPGAIVNARATVGRGAIVNSGAIIEHDCIVEPYAHVASGAVLAGGATAGGFCLVGAGAVVQPSVHVGTDAKLGAGAVAVSDIPDATTAVGVPARTLAPATEARR